MNTDSNITARILLQGAQEILGIEMVQQVVERLQYQENSVAMGSRNGFSLAHAGPFMSALEEMFGDPGSRGLALRMGRAAFSYGLKHYGDRAGFRDMEYRLLPAPRRLEKGLHSLAQIIAGETGSKITVTDEGAYWQWRVERRAAARDCFLIAGLLQEFASWAGGGRFYQVVETECLACGSPACIYRVEKKPLD